MAKGKRSSHRIQATRNEVAQARYAVRHGLISNKAKITKTGMSRNVKRKLEDLKTLGALPEYSTRKGSSRPHIIEQPQRVPLRVYNPNVYKGQGYSVFGNMIVTSKPKEVRRNIMQGGMGGATLFEEKGPAALRRGVMDRISLSRNGIRNFRDLRNALQDNKSDATLKHPDDLYSFLYFDNLPNPGRTVQHKHIHPPGATAEFLDGEDLLAYLNKYEAITENSEEAFKNFDLVRVHYTRNLRMERKIKAGPRKRGHHGSERENRERAMLRKARAMQQQQAKTAAEKKAEQRANETPEQRAIRLARDAERHRRGRSEKGWTK